MALFCSEMAGAAAVKKIGLWSSLDLLDHGFGFGFWWDWVPKSNLLVLAMARK